MNQQIEEAVSPVVGVMLMLVVVIIIAAVVSGFSGGLAKGTQAAPQLTLDVHIANNGHYGTSYFKATVTGVSAPIQTHDLKIITSWTHSATSGAPSSGGATVIPGITNFNVSYDAESTQSAASPPVWNIVCPQGDGPGVGITGTESANGRPYEGTGATGPGDIGNLNLGITNYTWFGNYNIEAGTLMYAQPFGAKYDGTNFSVGYGMVKQWVYNYGTDPSGAIFTMASTDEMQAVLGQNWNVLRPGDLVHMKVIHIPSGRVIWQGDIPVEGSVI